MPVLPLEVVAKPAVTDLGPRSIHEFIMLNEGEAACASGRFMEMKIFIDGPSRMKVPFISMAINTRMTCSWRGSPGNQILIGPDDRLRIEVDPPYDKTRILLSSRLRNGRHHIEDYRWEGGDLVYSHGIFDLEDEDDGHG